MRKTKNFIVGILSVLVCACATVNVNADIREDLVINLESQLDVRELTGNNDGPEVKAYLNHVGLSEGYAWCAAFIAFNLDALGVDNPRSAWSPHFARNKDMVYKTKSGRNANHVLPGDVFSLYFYRLKRVGHVGFIVGIDGNDFLTIEGNTNRAGSREGDGVYRKRRSIDKVYAVTRYIINNETTYRRESFEKYRHPVSLHASAPGFVRVPKLEKDGNGHHYHPARAA